MDDTEDGWALVVPHEVRWAECDLYAHMNHAAYLTLCEDLRVRHWLGLGLGFSPDAPGPVVSRLDVRYLRPLRFRDRVSLRLRVESLRRSSVVHDYAIHREGEGGPAFTCRAVLVVTRGGAPCPIPDAARARMLAEGARDDAASGATPPPAG